MTQHKDLSGTDLHVNKLHAETHAEGGTDEITVTDLAGIDTDGTLAANSDLKLASQKATKTYVDTQVAGATGTYTDEKAQDAVGAMVDSTLVYTDVTPLLSRAALTGDVTASAGSNALTIANDAVTYAKMQNVSAASKLVGRGAGSGSGDPQEITLGTNLSMSGTTLNAAGGALSDADYGDIVVSSSGTVMTIDTGAVSATKLANTAVTPGSYTYASITVDQQGRITAASNGSAPETAASSLLRTAYIWLEGDNVTALSDGTAVTLWPGNDRQGIGATGTSTARPTFETNEINSNPIIRFDGSNDTMALAASFPVANGFTVAIVAKVTSTANYGTICCGTGAGSLDLQFKQTSGKLAIVSCNTSEYLAQTTTPSAGYHRWIVTLGEAGDYTIYMDGSADGTVTNGTALSAPSVLGRNGASNNEFLAADVACLIMFARKLSSADRSTLNSYLSGKYI